MKKLLLFIIIPLLIFGQDNCYVNDTVKLINSFGGIYDDIFSLEFQSLTGKEEITNYNYSDTDGDGVYNFESPSSIEKKIKLTRRMIKFDHVGWEQSVISWAEMDQLINEDFIITYTIKKYGIDNSDEHLDIYEYKTGNYIINIRKISFNQENIKKIKEVLYKQESEWNNGNLYGFMLGYWNSDKLEFSSENVTTYGWKNTYIKYQDSYPTKEKMGNLKFEIVDVQLTSDTTSIVTGRWKIVRNDNNPWGGDFMLTFQKFNNNWLITKDHTTSK